jgi:heme exporter protein B
MPFFTVIARDIRLIARHGGAHWTAVLFLLMLVAVTPFALGSEPDLLMRVAPMILWLASMLALLLGLERLFHEDLNDGSWALMLSGTLPIPLVILAKGIAHFIMLVLPSFAVVPILALLLNVPKTQLPLLMLSLVLGMPALLGLGMLSAALGALTQRGGVFLTVLVLPLMVPVLIFGVAVTQAPLYGASARDPLLALMGLSILFSVMGVVSASLVLRYTS